MDTPYTIRAQELRDIYNSINMKYLTQDERLDVLLTLKHTVKEHDCKLTQEIIELIDREADLLMRGVKESNLDGLRKRISTLFLQYIKTPTFNPEAARLLKVKMQGFRRIPSHAVVVFSYVSYCSFRFLKIPLYCAKISITAKVATSTSPLRSSSSRRIRAMLDHAESASKSTTLHAQGRTTIITSMTRRHVFRRGGMFFYLVLIFRRTMLQELRRSDEKLNTTEKRTEYKRKSQITYLIQVQET